MYKTHSCNMKYMTQCYHRLTTDIKPSLTLKSSTNILHRDYNPLHKDLRKCLFRLLLLKFTLDILFTIFRPYLHYR